MFSETTEWYDAIYSFKDYAAEASKIRGLIRANCPGSRTILDVACGTGEHAKHLSADFAVDGIDLEPAFVRIAQGKNPSGKFQIADMRAFHLDKRYDVVQCLFSSIGYLLTPQDVVNALKCFANHVNPGGFVLVEPWLSPANFQEGAMHMRTVDQPDLKVCRINTCSREGDISIMDFHYLIATKDGVRRASETHRMALIAPEKMASHFKAAGLRCRFDPEGLMGRGLFIARPAKG